MSFIGLHSALPSPPSTLDGSGGFVGVDWAEAHHDVCLLDGDGKMLAVEQQDVHHLPRALAVPQAVVQLLEQLPVGLRLVPQHLEASQGLVQVSH